MKKLLFFLIFFVSINYNIVNAENKEPKVEAKGAILIDSEMGRVLFEKNADKIMPMASTTKIMTAIIALENGNLEDVVTVSKKASLAPNVKMGLKQGEKIKLKNLLYALMLESSNDSAIAIAEHISGDVDTFCMLMTKKAKEIGAKNTSFKTPNGLDADGHYSTPYDMATITKYAIKNDTFMNIINTKNISFKSDRQNYDIVNKNRLLNEYEGANGVKTGFTGKAGNCFVGSAKRGDLNLISVVLDSGFGERGKKQKWIDTKAILNYGFDNFKYEKILSKEDCNEIINIEKGKKNMTKLLYEDDVILPISNEEKENIQIKLDYLKNIKAPVKKGEVVGVANIYIYDKLVKTVNMLVMEDVEKRTFKENLMDILKFSISYLY